MDRAKLRSQVFEKTGIKLDVDDPIFALVALNEAVLEETVERHLERIEAASAELAQHARSAGGLPPAAASAASAASAPASPSAADAPPLAPVLPLPVPGRRPIATSHESFSQRELRLLGAALLVALLTASVMLVGQSMFHSAPALTPAQQAAIARADKLDKVLPTLEPKARSAVEEALAKP
ncbi:MAG TPA: hypothetical protein VGF27_08940 [Pseudoduganella sp.]